MDAMVPRSLRDARGRRSILDRLAALTPEHPRLWGRRSSPTRIRASGACGRATGTSFSIGTSTTICASSASRSRTSDWKQDERRSADRTDPPAVHKRHDRGTGSSGQPTRRMRGSVRPGMHRLGQPDYRIRADGRIGAAPGERDRHRRYRRPGTGRHVGGRHRRADLVRRRCRRRTRDQSPRR